MIEVRENIVLLMFFAALGMGLAWATYRLAVPWHRQTIPLFIRVHLVWVLGMATYLCLAHVVFHVIHVRGSTVQNSNTIALFVIIGVMACVNRWGR